MNERASIAGNLAELAEIVRDAPGRAAGRGAVDVLTAAAGHGDERAVRALGLVVAGALGREDHPLARILEMGYLSRPFLTELDAVRELADQVEEELPVLRELVRRDATEQHLVLAAFVLAVFADFAAYTGEVLARHTLPGMRLRIIREIVTTARVVPGDSVDATFEVGRAFILGLTSMDGFRGTMNHEFGHHLGNDLMGRRSETLDADRGRELGRGLAAVVAAARRLRGQGLSAGDPRQVALPSGLSIMSTAEDGYTHLSFRQSGGAIDLDYAIDCAHLAVRLLGAAPYQVAVAYSASGMFHLAVPGHPNATWVRLRAAARMPVPEREAAEWFAELSRTGRVADDEWGMIAVLTRGERPRMVYVSAGEQSMRDMTICAQLRKGDPITEIPQEERVRAAVACGDPVALRAALDGGYAGPLGLDRLGESRTLMEGEHLGSTAADIREVVAALHAAGLDVNGPADEAGGTLLVDAAARGPGLTGFLLAHGADPRRRGADGTTPLARARDPRTVELLVAAGADPDIPDEQGRTALHLAAAEGDAETVALLLASGARQDAADADGDTPLAYAASPAVAEALCAAGADPDAAGPSGRTPLMNAAADGRAEVAEALLRLGADPRAVTDTGVSALHFAAGYPLARQAVALVTLLLDAGAVIDEENNQGTTPLMVATMDMLVETVELLVSRGADVNARTVEGFTPLMHASDGRTEWSRDLSHNDRMTRCMRLLAAAGADLDAAGDQGWTALHFALLGFDAGPVACLLELGADPNLATDDGMTPLRRAREKGHEKMVEDLIRAGAR
ncbi:ankyrin repeat domain-containing protein [Acrocarpospora catenulata]|uniref:ankyrin repeat domain-containing protein n=1 Tax=Acrocarpospora catenulata TaxID=2836182 RepID=UPI001BDA3DEF|nr:ankyrin repeat domain-containing protein [Acrocarpospora catenulata]